MANYYYAAGSALTTQNAWNTWDAWNTTGGSTITASTLTDTGTIWGNWTTTSGNSTVGFGPQIVWNTWAQDVRTPEQKAADAEALRVAQAQADERAAARAAEQAEAVQRAETLLHENLRPGQRRMLRLRRSFYVRSQHGRRYEIQRGHHSNVFEVDGKGKRLNRLCVYATGGLPEADGMLAQKLFIEHDEDRLRRTAHITPVVA